MQIGYVTRKVMTVTTLTALNEVISRAQADLADLNKQADAIATRPITSRDEFLGIMANGNGDRPQSARELIAMGIPSSTAYAWWATWTKQSGDSSEL